MKKKIKDLTFEEKSKICDKHPNLCFGCPLYKTHGCKFYIFECNDEKEVELL